MQRCHIGWLQKRAGGPLQVQVAVYVRESHEAKRKPAQATKQNTNKHKQKIPKNKTHNPKPQQLDIFFVLGARCLSVGRT